jgi:RNA polymerase sigma-70 factor (ECF subfamily)
VNSALQRARKTVADNLPERSQQQTLRALGDARVRELVDAYVDAWQRGDAEAVRALLAEDAVFSMPPWSMWWRGGDTIAGFAEQAVAFCAEARPVRVHASGQPAVAYYAKDAETGLFSPTAIDVLTLEGVQIKELTAFVSPELFAHFGLPEGPLRAEELEAR